MSLASILQETEFRENTLTLLNGWIDKNEFVETDDIHNIMIEMKNSIQSTYELIDEIGLRYHFDSIKRLVCFGNLTENECSRYLNQCRSFDELLNRICDIAQSVHIDELKVLSKRINFWTVAIHEHELGITNHSNH